MDISVKRMQPIFSRINFCGCGTSMWGLIQMLLERGEDHEKNGSYYDPEDAQWPWIEFGAKVIDAWSLTEHGGSIGHAWLTEDGKALLAWLREHGTDSGDSFDSPWPEGWDHGMDCPCGCNK